MNSSFLSAFRLLALNNGPDEETGQKAVTRENDQRRNKGKTRNGP